MQPCNRIAAPTWDPAPLSCTERPMNLSLTLTRSGEWLLLGQWSLFHTFIGCISEDLTCAFLSPFEMGKPALKGYILTLYVFNDSQAGVCVGEKAHASVQLHGLGGVFLQLSGSAERRPAESRHALPRHLPKVSSERQHACSTGHTHMTHTHLTVDMWER